MRDRGGRTRITYVVNARERQRHGDAVIIEMQREVGAGDVRRNICCANIGQLAEPEADATHVVDERRPVVEVTVVCIENRGHRAFLVLQDFTLGARYALDRPESLEVSRTSVGNDNNVRGGESRQIGDLAGMIGAHFDHCEPVVLVDSREHQRHADVVVEVAVRGERRSLAAETGGDKLLERRLAIASRNADNRHVAFAPPGRAESAERHSGVVDLDLGNRIARAPRDHGPGRAVLLRNADILAAVKIRTLQREEQLAFANRARIGADANEGAIVPMQRPLHAACCLGERRNHRRFSRAASALAATAKSENATRSPLVSWQVS